MIITREKGMRMWGGGSGNTSVSGASSGGGFSLTVAEGEGTGNAYTDFTYESGTLTLNKATEFVTVDFFNKLFTAYDANGNVIAPNNTTPTLDNIKFKAGAWTEQYLSALGQNSSGGGGGGAGLEDVWDSLTNQQGTVITDNTKIAIAHIPDTSSTYGYLKASSLNGYATQTWVNQQGFLTTHQTLYTLSIYGGTTKVLDFKPNANASIYIKAGGDISLTNDTTNKYITLSYTHPTNGANTTISAANGKVLSAITVNNLGHVTSVSSKTLAAADIPDISATYATASRATTLESYFNSGGVAKVAAKLNTGTTTYSAWGQTYWSSGVPQSISGNMTSVGSITPSANGNALGTTSARFNIYGTAGNFSGNVSITGTLGVTGATTLTGLLTANGGIVVPSAKTIKIGDCTISWDSTNSMLKFDKGIYSTGAVSALGANSSGGGGGGADLGDVWDSLTNQTGTTPTSTTKIAVAHIPDISSTYGYAKTSQLGSYLPLSGGNMTGNITFASNTGFYAKDTGGTSRLAMKLDGTDNLLIGYGTSIGGSNTYIDGNTVYIRYGTSHTTGITLASGGNVTIANRLLVNEITATNSEGLLVYRPSSGWGGISSTQWGVGSADSQGVIRSSNADLIHYKGNVNYTILDSSNHGDYAYALYGGTDLAPTSTNTINLNDLRSTGSYYVSTNTPSQYVTNKPDDTQNYAFRVWVSASGGTSGYRRQRFQYLTQMEIYERFYSTDTSSWGNWYKVQGDLDGEYLKLTGGTITGNLTVNNALYTDAILEPIRNNGLLVYHPASGWGGISSTQWGVGSVDSQGVIRSSDANLIHFKGETNYTICDGSNTYVGSGGIGYINGSAISKISGNAGTATTLATPRTLWGQSFNGSANVSGNLSGVGDITATYYTLNDTAENPYLKFVNTYNSTNYTFYVQAYQGLLYLGAGSTQSIAVNSAGSLGVGTSSPAYKLHVYGQLGVTTASQGTMRFVSSGSKNYIQSGNAAFDGNADMIIGGYSATTGTNLNLQFSTVNATSNLKVKSLLFMNYGAEGIYLTGSGINWHNTSDTWTKSIMSFASNGVVTQLGGHFVLAGAQAASSTGNTTQIIFTASGAQQVAVSSNSSALIINPTSSTTTKQIVLGVGSVASTFGNSITCSGEVTASSDGRKKNIISNTKFNVKDIASARSVLFEWNDGRDDDMEKKIHGGSIAQDWLGKADSFLSQDKDGFYSINYGALALCSAITIAKEVVKHDDEITRLKKEVVKLRERVAELEERRA